MKPICTHCGDPYAKRRHALGYKTCLTCGDTIAKQTKHTVAPMNKSNYLLITDPSLLKQLNPKRTM